MSLPPGSPRSTFLSPGSLFAAAVLLVLGIGAALAWGHVTSPGTGERPDRLVEAMDPRPPAVLPAVTPGLLHAGDARRRGDTWWVLDRRAQRVHLLDADLDPVLSFGGRGGAPGEFESPSALGFLGDSLLVLDGGGTPVLHLFGPEGDFHRRIHVMVRDCDTFAATGLTETEEGDPILLGTCVRFLPVPSSGPVVVRLDPDGSGQQMHGELEPLRPGGLLPESAVGAPGPGGFWAGRSSRPCLTRLEGAETPGAPETVCLPEWVGVRFSLEEFMGRMSRASSPGRAAEVLGSIEWLPVMDRVFSHAEGMVIRRLSGLTSRDLVLLRPDGSMETLWSALPESSWVEGGEVLVAWDGMEGVHLERRSLAPSEPGARHPDP